MVGCGLHDSQARKVRIPPDVSLSNSVADKLSYITSRNRFKATCRRKKRSHIARNRLALISAWKNPKQFWKLLKEDVKNSSTAPQASSQE